MWWQKEEDKVKKWIEELTTGNPPLVRRQAAEALGKSADTRAIEALTKALDDMNEAVRFHAIRALGRVGLPAIEPLIQALENKDWYVRWEAIDALGRIRDSCAIEPLIHVFDVEDSGIQLAVAEALGEIRDLRTVEFFIRALKHPNSIIRLTVAKILGRSRAAQAIPLLVQTLHDRNSDVRLQAAKALDKMRWKPEDVMEKTYYLLAKRDWESYISLGSSAIEPLMQVFHDQTSFLQGEAEIALQKIYALIEVAIFKSVGIKYFAPQTTLLNPDVSTVTMPMSALEKIEIYSESYNFHQVERFITYAVNYIGQEHLKEHVEVHIYGDPEKLHPNLRNAFKNLCKSVEVYEKE